MLPTRDKIYIITLLSISLLSRVDSITPLILYGVLPCLTLGVFCDKRFDVKNSYFKILTILFLWIVFTSFFAIDADLSIRNLRQLVGVYMFCYIICKLESNERFISIFYLAYVMCFAAVVFYIQSHGLLNSFDFTSDRIASDENAGMNANEPAYYTFFLTVALYFIGEMSTNKNKRYWLYVCFILMIPLSFVIALLTGARQTLVIQIPTIIMLLLIRYNIKSSKSFVSLVLLVIIIAVSMPYVESIFSKSMLGARSEMNVTEDTRMLLLADAFNVGLEHPIVGVGPGCYYKVSYFLGFSHCSFTELFANSGVPAALLYIYMIILFLKRQIQRFFKYKSPEFLAFFVCGLMYAIYNFFYVFYQSLWLMAFFFVIATHSETFFKTKYKNAR